MAIKQFGEKLEGKNYQLRVGIHLLVFDDPKEKILLVSPPNGSYLLPGGERELDETHVETLKRESMEELGFDVTVGFYLGEADEYYYSTYRKNYYHNPAHFYVASSWKEVSAPLEEGNSLRWATLSEAIQLLKRGSHRWAVSQYMEQADNITFE